MGRLDLPDPVRDEDYQEQVDNGIAPVRGSYAVIRMEHAPGTLVWATTKENSIQLTFQGNSWDKLLAYLTAYRYELERVIRDVKRYC